MSQFDLVGGDLAPSDDVEASLTSSGSIQVQVNDTFIVTLYLNTTYYWQGPPTVGPPHWLGFKPGDQIRLLGSGPNSGKVVTLISPVDDNAEVLEPLVVPDLTLYHFQAIKRSV